MVCGEELSGDDLRPKHPEQSIPTFELDETGEFF
jgi:hypothetical protein